MSFIKVFSISLLVTVGTWGQDLNNKRFPSSVFFGTASASYQVEGAWNEDGKGESIWDRATHTLPSPVDDNSTGDIACDSYHKIKEDVAIMKDLGVDVYRFSISWSRIIPTGYANQINQAGFTYYKNLIKELKDNNIEPVVTIYHWDLPQPLQDIGGWPNELIISRYVEYAQVLFENFGKDVKYWLTFNEPRQICQMGYGATELAPFLLSMGIGEYMCAHNLLKAHAKAWHLYDDKYRQTQKGKVSMTINTYWMEPVTNNTEDVEAAERLQHFNFGFYANPLILGDYPSQMKEVIAKRSAMQGFSKSRLPEFTQEEIDYIKGTYDYIGLNFYTSLMVKNKIDLWKTEIGFEADTETESYQDSSWPSSASMWLKVTPWGFRKVLNWIKNTYGNVPILIAENGISDNGSSLEDDIRVNYYQTHLSALRDAMDDGVNIMGYTAWSIMDNFEWLRGYTQRFGIYSVDFNDPNRKRTPKKSATFYKKFLATRCVVDEAECTDP